MLDSDIVIPTDIDNKDRVILSSLSRLMVDPGWMYIVSKLQQDLDQLKSMFQNDFNSTLDLRELNGDKAIVILATDEINKRAIKQLEGLINLPSLTIAEILKKYENEAVDRIQARKSDEETIYE